MQIKESKSVKRNSTLSMQARYQNSSYANLYLKIIFLFSIGSEMVATKVPNYHFKNNHTQSDQPSFILYDDKKIILEIKSLDK